MWNDNESYQDYVEIRRRVERRLVSGMTLVVHSGLFMLGLVALIAIWFPPYESGGAPLLNFGMGAWSGLLFLHSLWTLRHSGSGTSRRLEAVRAEVEDRLEAEDTLLLANPRHVFRVSSLLDEDVRMRAGWVPALTFALFINCFLWGLTLVQAPWSGAMWHVVLMLAMLYLPATYVVNQTRRRLRDGKLRQTLVSRPPASTNDAAKRKRSFDADLERYARLTDDGELVDMPENWVAYERDRQK